MMKDGEILKAERGRYVHPDRQGILSHNPDKNGKKIRKESSETVTTECQRPARVSAGLAGQEALGGMTIKSLSQPVSKTRLEASGTSLALMRRQQSLYIWLMVLGWPVEQSVSGSGLPSYAIAALLEGCGRGHRR